MARSHVIDGVTYVEVDRNAEVGDKVIIVHNSSCGFKEGYVGKVTSFWAAEFAVVLDYGMAHYREDYRVLEPLKPTLAELLSKCTPENRHEEVFVEGTQASPQVIDMLANLARRVTSLERQLAATQRNVERQAEELENAKHHHVKHEGRLAFVEDRIEMLRDYTLDSRSQVLNAINKYYAEGKR